MSVTLFHHPEAGEGAWSADDLMAALREAGLDPAYRSADEDGWRDGLAACRDLAIVAGGDGTVARLATALPDRSVPIALLPTGSANNIARSLGAFGDLAELIATLPDATERTLPVGAARGRWGCRLFVEAVGIGAVADTVAALQDDELKGDDKRQAGRDALCRTLREADPLRAAPVLDGSPLQDDLLLFEVMNIAMIGPNLPLAPGAPAASGFEAVWLRAERRDAMLDWLAAGGSGPDPLDRRPVSRVTVQARDERLRVDDKAVTWDGHHMDLRQDGEPLRVKIPASGRGGDR